MSSEYERERLENIKRNEELMRELAVLGGSTTIGVPKAKPKPSASKRSEGRKRSDPAPRAKKEALIPTRASARLRGQVADSETQQRKWEEDAEQARLLAEAARRAKHEDHDLKALTGGLLKEEEIEVLRNSLMKTTSNHTLIKEEGTADEKKSGADRFSAETQELSKIVSKMELRSASKVTPSRVYSMVFHPTTDRDLIFMGDKEGSIGVWDALAPAEPGDGEEEEEPELPEGKAWALQTHGKSPITCLRLDPVAGDSLFSSSYDSTVRTFSLENGISTEIWAGDEDVLLSIFDILAPERHPTAFTATPAPGLDERSIWIGDHRGGILHLDLREKGKPVKSARRWQVSEKKIGAMSVNESEPNCIATASLDQNIRVFDVRALQTISETPDAPYNYKAVDPDSLARAHKKAEVDSYQAKRACTSVDFSPCGTKLVGVSYDDLITVWDVGHGILAPSADTKSRSKSQNASVSRDILSKSNSTVIRHNNQSGKWITALRARWTRNPTLSPHFSIGGMNRRAEIFSADGTLLRALYDETYVTAVPAVTAMHPSKPGRLATGNASGRATLWG